MKEKLGSEGEEKEKSKIMASRYSFIMNSCFFGQLNFHKHFFAQSPTLHL